MKKLITENELKSMSGIDIMNWGSDYWSKGYEAYINNILRTNNPYPKSSHEYFYWNQGWENREGLVMSKIVNVSKDLLNISKLPVEFMGFIPKYYVVDKDCCSWVTNNKPTLKDGYWNSDTMYEIGIDDSMDKAFTPLIVKESKSKTPIFKII